MARILLARNSFRPAALARATSAFDRILDVSENLIIERKGAFLWIRLNRPDKANALSVSLMEGAAAALGNAARDDTVRAILLTGSGERAFSAGADVREQPAEGDLESHRRRRSVGLAKLIDAIIDNPKPVIAVLNGVASGGGAMLALLSDARVAADTAAISLPEINLGMATFTGAVVAQHVGGVALAADLVQTGRRMPAAEALARGLVSVVVPRAELEAAALKTAATLADKNSNTFAANKRWLNRALKAALAEARVAQAQHHTP